MKKRRNYELFALVFGVIMNVIQGITGTVFYIITGSMSIFLDAAVSVILSFTSAGSIFISRYVNKKKSSKYPFGRKAIENMFLFFRAFLMLAMILYTIIDGAGVIIDFARGINSSKFVPNNIVLIIYGILMCGTCLILMGVYAYCYKMSEPKSEIVRIEIKASLYDGLVTFFAISSLLLFTNVGFFEPIEEIGDSITVILISVGYMSTPIKELINQFKILTDKRRSQKLEHKIIDKLRERYENYDFNDLYFAFTGNSCQIFISLYPKREIPFDTVEEEFHDCRKFLKEKFSECKVYLMLSKKKIHEM